MHIEAFEWVRKVAWSLPPLPRVLEFGSKLHNGTVVEVFTATRERGGRYLGVDISAGPNVGMVADAATVDVISLGPWDAVVCCETFEHTASGPRICANAHRHLRPGGVFIVTCAGPARAPHSGEGGALEPGEYYAGVGPVTLRAWLHAAGFRAMLIDGHSVVGDTYAVAWKAG